MYTNFMRPQEWANGIFKELNENVDDYVKHKSHTQTNITRDTHIIEREFYVQVWNWHKESSILYK